MSLAPTEYIILFLMCIPVLLVIALGIALLIRRGDLFSGKRLPCPYCAERIRPEAKVCPFCKRDLPVDWSKQNG